jgi:hypothetical protein
MQNHVAVVNVTLERDHFRSETSFGLCDRTMQITAASTSRRQAERSLPSNIEEG